MIRVINPVLDEEASIGSDPRDIPKYMPEVIVVDVGMADRDFGWTVEMLVKGSYLIGHEPPPLPTGP